MPDEAFAPERQQAFGGGEGREHQDLRGFTGPVVLLVRHQRDPLPLDATSRNDLASGHPQAKLALVRPFAIVEDSLNFPRSEKCFF